MNAITFIKLGGGLITDKTVPMTVRIDAIRTVSTQIQESLAENPRLQLMVGNGAGSFGHFQAIAYKMTDGIHDDNQAFGFCAVQDAVAQLNRAVVKEMLNCGIKALSLAPSSLMLAQHGKITHVFMNHVLQLLRLQIVPVFYGDIITDAAKGAHICSTEYLITAFVAQLLKKKHRVKRIIHCGITDGVLDDRGRLITHITPQQLDRLKKVCGKTRGFDVTGGMLHKVQQSCALARYGIETVIINGASDDFRLKRLLIDKKVEGTYITR